MTEYTFLVAVTISDDGSREDAENVLMQRLPKSGGPVECWWIAEDDRHDRSDNDSAVFVHKGWQDQADALLVQATMARNGGPGPAGEFAMQGVDMPPAQGPVLDDPNLDAALQSLADVLAPVGDHCETCGVPTGLPHRHLEDDDVQAEVRDRIAAEDAKQQMSLSDALNWAIFCMNDYTHPDASETSDVEELALVMDDVLTTLIAFRDQQPTSPTDTWSNR